MKQKSLMKNAIWNIIYTGSNLLFPLLTAPYITRVLGPENLGEVDFAQSLVQWFIIFAGFGVTTYGVRSISQFRDDRKKLSLVFSEIFFINLIFSIISTIIYLIFILNTSLFFDQLSLFVVMAFSVALNAVNIDWFYQGIEEYSYITLRNFMIKIISLILIFTFIKEPSDYVVYGVISIFGVSFSGVLNVLNSRKYVKISFKKLKLKKHLKPLFTFFLITFVVNIYTNMDVTLLGFMDGSTSVAYLVRSKMILGLAGTIATSIAAVSMPRASYYLKENFEKYKELINIVPKYMLILTIPMATGIALLSREIMYIIGGTNFLEASILLSLISIKIIFSTLSTFLQQQVLVPNNLENLGLKASIGSSIISLIGNFILIPRFSYLGVGIVLIFAELFAFGARYYYAKTSGISYFYLFDKSFLLYIISSMVMCLPIVTIFYFFNSISIRFLMAVTLGGSTYLLSLFLMKEPLFMAILTNLSSKYKKSK